MHAFPSLQVVMLAFAIFLFFAFERKSNVVNLNFNGVSNLSPYDFPCLVGGFARSLIAPTICYQLQAGAIDPASNRSSGANSWQPAAMKSKECNSSAAPTNSSSKHQAWWKPAGLPP